MLEAIPDRYVRCVGPRVRVRTETLEQKTAGGIVIPDNIHGDMKKTMNRGIVVSIGPTAYKNYCQPYDVEIGDLVFFQAYGGKARYDEGQDPNIDEPAMRTLNDEDIYDVVKRSDFKHIPSLRKYLTKEELE